MNSPNPSHGSFARVLVLTSVFIGCWLARAGDTSEASLRSGNSLPQSVVRAASSVSPRGRLLQLASQAPFQSPRLILLGEVAISEEETRELLGIYEQATAQYEGASTPLDRRLALVGWAERVTDFLAKYPQSAYFPGASLQLAAHHHRILNQTGVRQHAEAAWSATRDRTEYPAREVARESSFLLARSLLLSAEHVAFDELYKSSLAHSPRETEDRWGGLMEQRHHNVRNPESASNCGLLALGQLASALGGAQKPLGMPLAHRVGSEGVDLATLGRLGREAGLEVRAVRLSSPGTVSRALGGPSGIRTLCRRPGAARGFL